MFKIDFNLCELLPKTVTHHLSVIWNCCYAGRSIQTERRNIEIHTILGDKAGSTIIICPNTMGARDQTWSAAVINLGMNLVWSGRGYYKTRVRSAQGPHNFQNIRISYIVPIYSPIRLEKDSNWNVLKSSGPGYNFVF